MQVSCTKAVQIIRSGSGLLLAITLSACGTLSGNEPVQRKALSDVVDAIQIAVDTAAQESVWQATAQESEHWNNACKQAKLQAANACVPMQDAAGDLCRAQCHNGICDPVSTARCTQYLSGDIAGLCNSPAGATQKWCQGAATCKSSSSKAADICKNAGTLALPSLSKADLSLAVEQQQGGTASINLLVVTFGGGRANTNTNTVSMTLKPRIRSTDYGSTPMVNPPPAKVVSDESRKLAQELSALIVDAVRATIKEYDPGHQGVVARPPMLVSDLQVKFELEVTDKGSLGIKKTWGLPAGIDLSSDNEQKRTNTLTITYARTE